MSQATATQKNKIIHALGPDDFQFIETVSCFPKTSSYIFTGRFPDGVRTEEMCKWDYEYLLSHFAFHPSSDSIGFHHHSDIFFPNSIP